MPPPRPRSRRRSLWITAAAVLGVAAIGLTLLIRSGALNPRLAPFLGNSACTVLTDAQKNQLGLPLAVGVLSVGGCDWRYPGGEPSAQLDVSLATSSEYAPAPQIWGNQEAYAQLNVGGRAAERYILRGDADLVFCTVHVSLGPWPADGSIETSVLIHNSAVNAEELCTKAVSAAELVVDRVG